ncbi:hypothetical protein RRG08_045178 [Elysia crispata]|uniref:Uncharacterized protein n=1 Tax=Elysia crispata TaxID=231223 RepID=A0AAE1ACQ1_9GAST|nr:hypothetical protein RRG08_045178 [Elysia crispata]
MYIGQVNHRQTRLFSSAIHSRHTMPGEKLQSNTKPKHVVDVSRNSLLQDGMGEPKDDSTAQPRQQVQHRLSSVQLARRKDQRTWMNGGGEIRLMPYHGDGHVRSIVKDFRGASFQVLKLAVHKENLVLEKRRECVTYENRTPSWLGPVEATTRFSEITDVKLKVATLTDLSQSFECWDQSGTTNPSCVLANARQISRILAWTVPDTGSPALDHLHLISTTGDSLPLIAIPSSTLDEQTYEIA